MTIFLKEIYMFLLFVLNTIYYILYQLPDCTYIFILCLNYLMLGCVAHICSPTNVTSGSTLEAHTTLAWNETYRLKPKEKNMVYYLTMLHLVLNIIINSNHIVYSNYINRKNYTIYKPLVGNAAKKGVLDDHSCQLLPLPLTILLLYSL